MTDDTPVGLNRTERVLVTMVASVAGLSLLCIAIVLIAQFSGVEDFSGGIWPMLAALPGVGLPIAFLLLIAFVVVSLVRRRRLNSGDER